MQSMSRVELYAAIRRDSRVSGLSSRDLAGKYRVGRAFSWLRSLPVASTPAVAFTHEALIKAILCAVSEDGDSHYRKAEVRNCSVHLIESCRVGKGVEWALRSENILSGS
jgi:hypothetical protein